MSPLFTAMLPGEDRYRIVLAIDSNGLALVADDDGTLHWRDLEGGKLGAFHLDPLEQSWWAALQAADQQHEPNTEPVSRASRRRALRG